jgi:addiction module RelE/StbE family toxin
MWSVAEARAVEKALAKAPRQIVRKYELWKAIVQQSGVAGLRAIPSFNDEALSGEWKGYRSSRLTLQYRVVYRVEADTVTVYVMRVTAHDYGR